MSNSSVVHTKSTLRDSFVIHAVKEARISEVQAIAIYKAELFWIKKQDRRLLLDKIYQEECSHDVSLSKWVNVSAFVLVMNQYVGYLLGTFFALLPWSMLCKVQSWAESQAAQIYGDAAEKIIKYSINQPDTYREIIDALKHAQEQELAHSKLFADVYSTIAKE